MGKKRKLRDLMEKRNITVEPTLVVCVGKKCVKREESLALVADLKAYIESTKAPVRLEIAGCLHVCKKGPIVATFPKIKFKKRVDVEKGQMLVDKLARPPE